MVRALVEWVVLMRVELIDKMFIPVAVGLVSLKDEDAGVAGVVWSRLSLGIR